MNDKLERYKSALTREQLITALDKAIQNAQNLFSEAQILYNNERFSRTYFLLCICNEELGKYIMITSAIVELVNENIDWKKFWLRLRNHKDKTGTIEHVENIFISNDINFTNPNDIQKILPQLEEFKMASLYSDMFQNNFYEPDEIIPRHVVDSYLKLTSSRIAFISSIIKSRDILKSITKEDVSEFSSKFRTEAFKER